MTAVLFEQSNAGGKQTPPLPFLLLPPPLVFPKQLFYSA